MISNRPTPPKADKGHGSDCTPCNAVPVITPKDNANMRTNRPPS